MVLRLSTFPSDVRGVVLAGLSTATSAVISATDTVLTALGKLQAALSGEITRAMAAEALLAPLSGATLSNPVIGGIPADYTLDLNFLSGVLDSRITFTRASVGTYFDNTGTMQTAAANVARFDHSPAIVDSASTTYAYAPLGLLIEEARTNLALYSNAVGGTNWGLPSSGTALAVTLNASAGLDGTVTASRVAIPAVSGASNYGFVDQAFTATAAVYTISVWLRGNAGGEQVWLMLLSPTITYYRLSVVLTTAWQRFSLVTGALTAGTAYFQIGTDLRDGSQAATPAQTIYAWGGQLELGAFATSFIPTSSAAVTRAADVATMPVGSWFTQALGSLAVDAQLSVASATNGAEMLASLDDGSLNNRVALYRPASSAAIDAVVTLAGSAVYAQAAGTSTPGTAFRAAIAYTGGAQATALAGALGTAGTAATMPSALTTLRLGADSAGSELADGYLRRIRYWARALSTTELQTVTGTAPSITNVAIDGSPIGLTYPREGAFTALSTTLAPVDASAYTVAPATGGTVTIPGTAARCVINPSGTLATLTVVSPAAPSLGAASVQSLDIIFTQAVTTLSWTAGSGTTFGGTAMPASVALGACVRLLWVQSLAKWLHSVEV